MTMIAPPPSATPSSQRGRTAMTVAGLAFQNPIVLASGTAGYGHELVGVLDIDAVGGLATKAVSLAPRPGNPSPRVAEFPGGMINAVGLANPGVEAVAADHLPWIAANLRRTRILVNVVGFGIDEFARVIERLDGERGVDAFELNVSCPNTKAGGLEFGADPAALRSVVEQARRVTRRPIFVKLSPTLPNLAASAQIAADAGADALTLVNTLPGLVIDVERRRPLLGFGSGGVSGAGLLPVGVLATWRVSRAVSLPIVGLGGVRSATDALQYLVAGASLVGIGTAAMQDPRVAERIVHDLDRWCVEHGITDLRDLIGTLEWPT